MPVSRLAARFAYPTPQGGFPDDNLRGTVPGGALKFSYILVLPCTAIFTVPTLHEVAFLGTTPDRDSRITACFQERSQKNPSSLLGRISSSSLVVGPSRLVTVQKVISSV